MPPATATDAPVRLSARGLQRRFGDRVALASLDLELRAGERLAVIGPNGAGKTTLLSILAGALAPSGGELQRAGDALPGWVPQQPAVYARLSVAENLRLFARLEGVADPEAAVARMLAQSGLAERASEQVARLSGGAQQRLNIAIGLLCEPEVLLLDEPSSSLDPRQRELLWQFIGGLAQRGTTVVYSTHNVAEAERYAERVLVLVDGEALFCGTPAALRAAAGRAGESAGQADIRGPDLIGREGRSDASDFELAFVAFLHARGH